MRQAVKSTVIGVLRARADAERNFTFDVRFFDTEQTEMETMAIGISDSFLSALVGENNEGGVIGELVELFDNLVDRTVGAIKDEVAAIGALENAEIRSREKFANQFTAVDIDYRQAVYAAENDLGEGKWDGGSYSISHPSHFFPRSQQNEQGQRQCERT
jgi:hypothetical protein